MKPGPVYLPLYDPPELAAAHARWLGAIKSRLIDDGRFYLDDGPRWEDARHPFYLSQIDGYRHLHLQWGTRWTVIATPRYCAEGCKGATYSSAVLVRADDPARTLARLRGRAMALDRRDGDNMNGLRRSAAWLARDGRFFGAVEVTGSQRAALAAPRGGEVDACVVDAVLLALLRQHAPAEVEPLQVVMWTRPVPAPAYICMPMYAELVPVLREALAIPAPPELLIDGIEVLPDDAYDAILALQQAAVDKGYPELQ